jgi:hypothetical protein
MGMAWVFGSIDKDPATYKDFVAILKTYTYRQSSLAYMFVYILVTFTLDANQLYLLNSFK